MCRFICYLGKTIIPHDLVFNTEHSLINQSKNAKKRADPVNGDGFGLGWYPIFDDPEPGVFKSIEPAWNNRNLYYVSSKLQTRLFFAHIRDASPEIPVTQTNCHPFNYGPFLWMHNGWLQEFAKIKRLFLQSLTDRAFLTIQGNTDSEYAFALFLDEIDFNYQASETEIENALLAVIDKIYWMRIKASLQSNAQMNFAVSNGKSIFVSRFSTILNQQPASLFYFEGKMTCCEGGFKFQKDQSGADGNIIVVASEPLSSQSDCWQRVERNHYLKIDNENSVKMIAMPGVVD